MPTKNTKKRNYETAEKIILPFGGWHQFTPFHWYKYYEDVGRIDFWPSTNKIRYTPKDAEEPVTLDDGRHHIVDIEAGRFV